ncbi:hypothetical protein BX616_009744, partial [Lobosporangium transversale]
IPIINGVATPLNADEIVAILDQNRQTLSDKEQDNKQNNNDKRIETEGGTVYYELDHKVPSANVFEAMYLSRGSTNTKERRSDIKEKRRTLRRSLVDESLAGMEAKVERRLLISKLLQQQQQQHQQQHQQQYQQGSLSNHIYKHNLGPEPSSQDTIPESNNGISNAGLNSPSLKDVLVAVDENPLILQASGKHGAVESNRRAKWNWLPLLQSDPILVESNGGAVEGVGRKEGKDNDDDDFEEIIVPEGFEGDEGSEETSNDDNDNKINVRASSGSITSRGLIPSVLGAHHCTPQFCVNVSLSDDAKFATFHIERPLKETGWISLGIGYAMTMADLLIFWPNPSTENGGGPRGVTFSRRTSHAYVEPQPVGQSSHRRGDDDDSTNDLGDNEAEASLYPPNEYILHNANSVANSEAIKIFPDSNRFIVQFTRPVQIKNTAFKLTPGEEQDFCWAYSPQPISPDSVADPAAHISQHLSVGTFALDVGANQPQLKDAILIQKQEQEQLDAAEKERTRKEQEAANRRIEGQETGAEAGAGTGAGAGTEKDRDYYSSKYRPPHGSTMDSSRSSDAASLTAWLVSLGNGRSMALQASSWLIALTLMYLFR